MMRQLYVLDVDVCVCVCVWFDGFLFWLTTIKTTTAVWSFIVFIQHKKKTKESWFFSCVYHNQYKYIRKHSSYTTRNECTKCCLYNTTLHCIIIVLPLCSLVTIKKNEEKNTGECTQSLILIQISTSRRFSPFPVDDYYFLCFFLFWWWFYI